MLVNIALPLAVDSTFTYLVPPELEQSACIGVRVLVPFGRKYATGLIVEIPESTSLTSLKPVKDILDSSPLVSAELLKLCRWISEYYFTPLGEVLKAALPHSFASSSKRLVSINPAAPPEKISEEKNISRQRSKLLELLEHHGPITSADLKKRLGLRNISALLSELERTGVLLTEEVLPQQKTGKRTREVLVLKNLDAVDIEQAKQSLSARKKKARRLLDGIAALLIREVDEIPVLDLLKQSGTTLATFREFKKSGLLRAESREISTQQEYGIEEQTLSISLNEIQQEVLTKIAGAVGSAAKPFLLHGVTGSGKTQVYIEAIRHALHKNRSAIVLVPEISLTPQTARRFKSHFEDKVDVVHSNMSANDRHLVWQRARSGKCRVIIGPRSAVFAPLMDLGLIVVDEEHEPSYKQFDAMPRYNARDVAIVRGKMAGAAVVLGSATPSAESYHNAVAGKYDLLEMPTRVNEIALPDITIVDMVEERKREYFAMKNAVPEENRMQLREFQQCSFSALLQDKIRDRLTRGEGIILLQNRRGFSPFIECLECGHTLTCPQCSVTYTYHITRKHLRCHYCGRTEPLPPSCPECTSPSLQQRGAGTQRVEQELASLFPSAKILRMDMDTTTRKGSHERLLKKFGDGDADILLGTQMVAKGLDFARVTLVGVISADTQMLLPDFRATERTFQLLTQVAGRAGRSTLKGEVIIQTHQPHNYTLECVAVHDFKKFFEVELDEREELDYPPFSRLALIEFKGKKEDQVRSEAERFARQLRSLLGTFTILGPSPAVISKIRNHYRWHIIIKNVKSKDPAGTELRHAVRKTLADLKRQSTVRIIVDVDPVGLM